MENKVKKCCVKDTRGWGGEVLFYDLKATMSFLDVTSPFSQTEYSFSDFSHSDTQLN